MANTTIRYKVEDKVLQASTKRLNALFAALAKEAGLSGDEIDAMFKEVDAAFAQNRGTGTVEELRELGEEAQRASAAAKRASDTIEKESQQGETAVEETT